MKTLRIIVTDTLVLLGLFVVGVALLSQGPAGLLLVAVLAPVAWVCGAVVRRVWGLIDAR